MQILDLDLCAGAVTLCQRHIASLKRQTYTLASGDRRPLYWPKEPPRPPPRRGPRAGYLSALQPRACGLSKAYCRHLRSGRGPNHYAN